MGSGYAVIIHQANVRKHHYSGPTSQKVVQYTSNLYCRIFCALEPRERDILSALLQLSIKGVREVYVAVLPSLSYDMTWSSKSAHIFLSLGAFINVELGGNLAKSVSMLLSLELSSVSMHVDGGADRQKH